MRLVLVILCWAATALGAAAQGGGDPRLAELRERIARRSTAEAVSLADRIADEALQAGSPGTAALALRLVGNFHLMEERLPQARAALTRARDVAQTHGLVVPEQAAILLLSRADALEGRADAVTPMVLQALDVLERQQAPHEELIWAYSQAATALLTTGVHGDVLARGVARLTPTDRFAPACSLWQSWGDRNFNTADYGEAHEALTKALACYEALGERADTGRVLVSLGRVQRAHGQLDAALALYQRAARLQEAAGDLQALLQSLNAQAVTYDRLGQTARAEHLYRAALARAQRAGLERYEVFLRGNLAGSLLLAGRFEPALAELREVLRREKQPYLRAVRLRQSAQALRFLGRYDEAFAALAESKAILPTAGFEDRVNWLTNHADLLARTGRLDEAQRDLDEAVRLIEDARSRALASDAARRGYGETTQGVFAVAIDVAMRRGATTDALELAEQARARALLDLMRDGSGQATAVVPDAAAMRALAAQLASTLLVYWVGADHTLAWVIGPDRITAHRLPAGETELRRWVQEAAGSGNVPGAINAALLGGPSLRSWRALHRALIAPLAADLPTDPGSRLTVVPHGPLLHLPFAGLLDTRGRYLIERHTLHYTPSIAVLAATVARASGEAPAAALVVGEPTALPRLPGVQLPPRLPYAREEARRVARRFGDDARLVLGRAATERAVRAQVGAAGWVHVATHARVSEEATAPSYLLLARGTGEAADDGRLTADEVRSLSLAGATVVLSACRTALGRVTGEGTLGFTRSFLAAGARAIVATTWEMPDDAGLRMMDAFYAARAGGSSVTAALRTAQLRQLRALRAGTLTRKVGGQEIRLPATPLLWAGYLAVGVP
jgi:CHAT domain-containing protein